MMKAERLDNIRNEALELHQRMLDETEGPNLTTDVASQCQEVADVWDTGIQKLERLQQKLPVYYGGTRQAS